IHTDITILASDESIGAHRAVLAAHSPVFNTMFTHNLKEKDSSSINIPDMSIVACHAFLSYLYSNNIQYQEFLTHRLDLLKAADKYDVTNLKDACQESLIEDIDSENIWNDESMMSDSLHDVESWGEPRSIWSERFVKNVTTTSAFGRMLSESIHTVLPSWLLMEALGLTGQFLQPIHQSLIACSPTISRKKIRLP
nr:BTB/POZ domain-containing protein [Tanacetum cinerariifolium]